MHDLSTYSSHRKYALFLAAQETFGHCCLDISTFEWVSGHTLVIMVVQACYAGYTMCRGS